jgi:hypothetical protein
LYKNGIISEIVSDIYIKKFVKEMELKIHGSSPVPNSFKLFEKAAKNGHIPSQYECAVSYSNGNKVKKDLKKAFDWYQKAAEKGYSKAQFKLGECYEDGLGIEKEKGKALTWYKKAAENGNLEAQIKLGNCYDKGKIDVEKNEKLAFGWYRKAADQGDIKSKKYCTVNGLTYKTYDAWKKAKDKKR